jgi:hypothetical protein
LPQSGEHVAVGQAALAHLPGPRHGCATPLGREANCPSVRLAHCEEVAASRRERTLSSLAFSSRCDVHWEVELYPSCFPAASQSGSARAVKPSIRRPRVASLKGCDDYQETFALRGTHSLFRHPTQRLFGELSRRCGCTLTCTPSRTRWLSCV